MKTTTAILNVAKQEIAKMSDENIKKAYMIFKEENDKLGMALAVDEVQARYPKIFNELYDDETFEIDHMEFINRAIQDY